MGVNFSELLDAFEFVSSVGSGENTAYLCKATGKIYWHSDWADDVEELPDEVEDKHKDKDKDKEKERYIPIPDKRELDLGKPLALKFARHYLPDEYDKAWAIFSRAGAYARFKDLLEHRRVIGQWYDFEQKATEEALKTWCEKNDIEVSG
jgi:hypothetical protein